MVQLGEQGLVGASGLGALEPILDHVRVHSAQPVLDNGLLIDLADTRTALPPLTPIGRDRCLPPLSPMLAQYALAGGDIQ